MHELESLQVARQITTTLNNANVTVAHPKYKLAEQWITWQEQINNSRTLSRLHEFNDIEATTSTLLILIKAFLAQFANPTHRLRKGVL